MTEIKDEKDLDEALKEILHYFEVIPKPNSKEAKRFDELANMIIEYENKYWDISKSSDA